MFLFKNRFPPCLLSCFRLSLPFLFDLAYIISYSSSLKSKIALNDIYCCVPLDLLFVTAHLQTHKRCYHLALFLKSSLPDWLTQAGCAVSTLTSVFFIIFLGHWCQKRSKEIWGKFRSDPLQNSLVIENDDLSPTKLFFCLLMQHSWKKMYWGCRVFILCLVKLI